MSEHIVVVDVSGVGVAVPGPVALTVGARIGRGLDSDLILDDPKVSERHAHLTAWSDGAEVALVDDGSFNGTYEGDTRIQTRPLDRPVVLRLGGTLLAYRSTHAPASRVVRIELPGEPVRRQVLTLPCSVGLDRDGQLALRAQDVHFRRAVLLLDDQGLYLLERVDDTLVVARPDDDGWLVLGEVRLRETEARDFSMLPTDLSFGDDDDLHPRLSLSDVQDAFPPACFRADVVRMEDLRATGIPLHESRYLALGGGIGSFCWVDALRIHGVPATQIRAVGFEAVPYARYKRLCGHSQIPDFERLRSNSESCPDNLWGFPGYGLREALRAMVTLRLTTAVHTTWQLTAEPDYSYTYTPRAGHVFRSIDREARRIGWSKLLHTGRIRSIRRTDDGRYAVAVSSREQPDGPVAIYLATVLHLALGYPGVQFLSDLRTYRERTRDFERVVNAYEDHAGVYQQLQERGGTVVLRGRGIVASRVLQRLAQVRRRNPDLRVVHLMRSPNTRGHRSGAARRRVEHHWEFQPFNWPEACWGGDLQQKLASAKADKREELLRAWGGTTTAARPDWLRIVRTGLCEGWYRIVFGTVADIHGDDTQLSIGLATDNGDQQLPADFIIDATGLVASAQGNPVLADLIRTYDVPVNRAGGLTVSNRFEVQVLRHGYGRVFAAGVTTLGGPYAPVDSFLGLQFAAMASLEGLAPTVRPLDPGRSVAQWLRWVRGVAP